MRQRPVLLLVALAVLVASVALVRAQAPAQTVTGYLVDVKCAMSRANDAGFPAEHTKDCMLMDACMKSGYGVMTADKKLIKFDAAGNKMALDLLKKTQKDKDWKVTVKGTMKDGALAVEFIAVL